MYFFLNIISKQEYPKILHISRSNLDPLDSLQTNQSYNFPALIFDTTNRVHYPGIFACWRFPVEFSELFVSPVPANANPIYSSTKMRLSGPSIADTLRTCQ